MRKRLSKGKVFMALSGGVDSSVSAALLQKEGYDVTGVFIKVWEPDFLPCTWREERRDAMRVAARLGIPFLTFDLEKEYKSEVVDYMIREYRAGRTPNPDVFCNKYVKFGAFFDRAMKLGADYIATGHYAQAVPRSKRAGECRLLAAKDHAKDQTYFLWTIRQDMLAKTLFPVGHLPKTRVRALAKRFGLFTAKKKDSQGLCFIGKLDMKDFLSHYLHAKKGKVLDEKGNEIGSHDGAWFLTPGERHGFTVTKKTPRDEPLYVLAKDVKKNTVVVGPKPDIAAYQPKHILLRDANIISSLPESCFGRARYHDELVPCKATKSKDGTIAVSFPKKRPVLAPGQSFVFYRGGECLGGGIIA